MTRRRLKVSTAENFISAHDYLMLIFVEIRYQVFPGDNPLAPSDCHDMKPKTQLRSAKDKIRHRLFRSASNRDSPVNVLKQFVRSAGHLRTPAVQRTLVTTVSVTIDHGCRNAVFRDQGTVRDSIRCKYRHSSSAAYWPPPL